MSIAHTASPVNAHFIKEAIIMKIMDQKEFDAQNVFGLGQANTAYAQYFIGDSFLNPLTRPQDGLFLANVTFEPGCRNNWHIHHARNKFELQKANISISGFEMQRTDADLFNNAQTKNISELQYEIDTLTQQVNSATTRSYDPLLKERIFVRDTTVITDRNDSVVVEKRDFRPMDALDSLATLDLRSKDRIWSQAVSAARNSRSMFSFDESQAKNALNQLYRSKVEWHKKLALPVTIIIFFLIGAPLGAIVRRGGLGMPIVISVIFFVIYYIISSSGEKMAKEGTWEAFYGTWLSAFVLAPVAIYLTYKATNDSGLLDVDWYVVKFKKIKEKISGIFARFAHKNKK